MKNNKRRVSDTTGTTFVLDHSPTTYLPLEQSINKVQGLILTLPTESGVKLGQLLVNDLTGVRDYVNTLHSRCYWLQQAALSL